VSAAAAPATAPARWRFRAVDADGAVVAGELDAADSAAAVAALRAAGRLPLEVSPAPRGLWAALNADVAIGGALRSADRVAFTRGLAALSEASLPLDRALQTLQTLGGGRAVRQVAGRLLAAVRGGDALSAAMEREGAAFPPAYRSIVRAGEAAGALAPALSRLADGEEAQARRRAAVRSALVYPAFLLVAAVAAITVLLTVVAPTFAPMLRDADVAPPLTTRLVMGAGDAVQRWWPLALAVVAAFAIVARLALARPRVRAAWHRALLRAPVIGAVRRKLASARVARALGELLGGGVALLAALRLARDAAEDAALTAEMDRIAPLAEAGAGLAGPLRDGGLLAPLAVQLIAVGEETGRLAPMLLKAADILEEEGRVSLERLTSLLTPLLTLVMGGLIAVIVSSFLFALSSINELAVTQP